MNIHGHKLRIAKINDELKKGFWVGNRSVLERRKLMHQHIILNLRKNKKVRIKKRK